MKTSADLMSRIRLLVVLGLTGCVTVQAPAAPQVETPAEAAAPEVDAVEATPSVTVSDQCDPSLITRVDDADPEFINGIGEGTSRMRSLARTQAMARARADMASKVGLVLKTAVDDVVRSRGANAATATIQAVTNQKIAESTEATLVGVRLVKASMCQMADLWIFTSLVQARADDILAASLEAVMEATIIEIAESDTPGPTSEYIKIFHDEMKARVEDILDKNRRPGGMSYS